LTRPITAEISRAFRSGNCLDDDKCLMLASGLADNISVTHLDLSHNKVGQGMWMGMWL
jgi:hypothetical protein